MESADHLSLGQFLTNAATLLDAMRGDAETVQMHLAELLEAFTAAAGCAGRRQPDLVVLQSLDRLTQVMQDLSAAFLALSPRVAETGLGHWQTVAAGLKLEHVRQALGHGERPDRAHGHTELF